MNRVTHFEIHIDEVERAISFYKAVFGWKIEKWDGPMDYWLIMTGKGKGIDGALMKRTASNKGDTPIGYICTINVSDLDAYIKKVEQSGGKIDRKNEIPGVGVHAQCVDTEGNRFGMMEASKK